MKALINDWRGKWHNRTCGGTDVDFPFGYVQLNSNGGPSALGTNPTNTPSAGDPYGAWHSGFTGIRWAQTETLRAVHRTFQAVILDTPIANGWIHSPYKQPAGARLARAALAAAYGMSEHAPVTATATSPTDQGEVLVTVNAGTKTTGLIGTIIDVRSELGFEVLGADSVWHSTPILKSKSSLQSNPAKNATITLSGAPPGARAIRYLWYTTPCSLDPFKCPVYVEVPTLGSETGEREHLPLGPFIASFEA